MLLSLAQNWWVLALRGLFAIIFGILALVWPGLTLGALVLIFGAYAIIDGVTAVIAAVRGRGMSGQWGLLLLIGLIGLVAGIVAILLPGLTLLALVYVAASWAVIIGILQIIAAIQLRKEIDNEWWLALSGVASIALGVLLAVWPSVALATAAVLIGIFAIISGVLLVALGFRLRGLRDSVRERIGQPRSA